MALRMETTVPSGPTREVPRGPSSSYYRVILTLKG